MVQQNDPVLQPFLNANTEIQARKELDKLFHDYIEPLLLQKTRGSWKKGVHNASNEEELEEVLFNVKVGLITKMNKLCYQVGEPIIHFETYLAVAIKNAQCKMLKNKYPLRQELRQEIMDIVKNPLATNRLALWEVEEKERRRKWEFVGLKEWQGEKTHFSLTYYRLLEEPVKYVEEWLLQDGYSQAGLSLVTHVTQAGSRL